MRVYKVQLDISYKIFGIFDKKGLLAFLKKKVPKLQGPGAIEVTSYLLNKEDRGRVIDWKKIR